MGYLCSNCALTTCLILYGSLVMPLLSVTACTKGEGGGKILQTNTIIECGCDH
jgi:hypothetical protein